MPSMKARAAARFAGSVRSSSDSNSIRLPACPTPAPPTFSSAPSRPLRLSASPRKSSPPATVPTPVTVIAFSFPFLSYVMPTMISPSPLAPKPPAQRRAGRAR